MSGHPVRVVDARVSFDVQHPSAVFSFGAAVAGALTLAHARVRVEDRHGNQADGWGAILLSYPWAFPDNALSESDRDSAMRSVLENGAAWIVDDQTFGHPVDHFLRLEQQFDRIEDAVVESSPELSEIPRLATSVALSPLDAAIHDAYGRLHNRSSFDVLSSDFTGWDLGEILGTDYRGVTLDSVLAPDPVDELTVYHTVGGADEIHAAVDGISLRDWIERDGVHAFKVKLKGQDLEWDTNRILDVYSLASAMQEHPIRIFADLNEQAPSLEYIQHLLEGLERRMPGILQILDALEQPDRRYMTESAMDFNRLSDSATIALDEGLVSLASIDRAHQLGYRGLCLKTCKCQSLMLLSAAIAEQQGLSLTVQDLTNPGISLHQSLGLAARLKTVMPVETNQRQFYPHASDPEKAHWPRLYEVRDGKVNLQDLEGPGFGFDPAIIDRPVFRD